VTTSGNDAVAMEETRPRIERSFESSRLEDEFLAVAYEMAVPFASVAHSRVPLDGLERLTPVLAGPQERSAPRAQ
jgi:hypothetical protein